MYERPYRVTEGRPAVGRPAAGRPVPSVILANTKNHCNYHYYRLLLLFYHYLLLLSIQCCAMGLSVRGRDLRQDLTRDLCQDFSAESRPQTSPCCCHPLTPIYFLTLSVFLRFWPCRPRLPQVTPLCMLPTRATGGRAALPPPPPLFIAHAPRRAVVALVRPQRCGASSWCVPIVPPVLRDPIATARDGRPALPRLWLRHPG